MKKLLPALLCILLLYTSAHSQDRKTVKIETDGISMVLAAEQGGKITWQYYGARLDADADFTSRGQYENDLYTTFAGFHEMNPAIRLTHEDGVLTTEFVYQTHVTNSIDDNRQETVITLKDKLYPVYAEIHFTTYKKENIITQYVVVRNMEKKLVINQVASSYVPVKADNYYLTSFWAAWGQEMQMQEEMLTKGVKTLEIQNGMRATRTHSPSYLISKDMPASENVGEVYGGYLAWSGNYKMNFQVDVGNTLHITAGMNDTASDYNLRKGGEFISPTMIHTYSSSGKGQVSRNFHDWARNYGIANGDKPNAILLNSWEGVYFDFDEPTLLAMIDDAADMGIEMFVLDDGWFGNKYPRNAPNAGLGDWQVNKAKLPNGIGHIADYAVSKGMRFGIWMEPEMVNPESELAKKHPEWIVKSGNRDIPMARTQYVLDLTNPKVQDFIYQSFIDVVSSSPNITYVKWDANRAIANAGSQYLSRDNQTHFWYDFIKGLYSVYERIRAKYPEITIQACGAGGARMDYGVMKYHDEFWASDNTSALERVYIQYGASTFMPAKAIGAHVSVTPNHQTGVMFPLKFRFDVAMSGRLGFELQPKDLNAQEREFSRKAVETYKMIRPVVQFGDLYRLKSPYGGTGSSVLMYVSKDKKQAVFFGYSLSFHGRAERISATLEGLDPARTYKVTELNMEDGKPSTFAHGKSFSGDFLIKAGINLDIKKPYTSTVLLLTAE